MRGSSASGTRRNRPTGGIARMIDQDGSLWQPETLLVYRVSTTTLYVSGIMHTLSFVTVNIPRPHTTKPFRVTGPPVG